MNIKEVVELVNSFNDSKNLLYFMNNFGNFLDFKNQEIVVCLLHQYNKLDISENKNIDNLLKRFPSPLNEEINLYIKDNFPSYYLSNLKGDEDLSKDLYFITENLYEGNVDEYIKKGLVNDDNINSLMSSNELDYSAFTEILRHYRSILKIDMDVIWEGLLNENEINKSKKMATKINSKVNYLFDIKIFPSVEKTKEFIKSFLNTSSMNNKENIKAFIKQMELRPSVIMDILIDKKPKKVDEKLLIIFSVMNKESVLENINKKHNYSLLENMNIDMFHLIVKIMTMNPLNKNYFSLGEMLSLVKIMDGISHSKEPLELIKRYNKDFYKVKNIMKSQDSFKEIIFNSFSFDGLSRKDLDFFEEGRIIPNIINGDKNWGLFFNYFAETCKVKKPNYFREVLMRDISFESWNTIIKIIEKNSPKFFKEIKNRELSEFKNNPKIYAIIEKERLSKNLNDDKILIIKNKKRL